MPFQVVHERIYSVAIYFLRIVLKNPKSGTIAASILTKNVDLTKLSESVVHIFLHNALTM